MISILALELPLYPRKCNGGRIGRPNQSTFVYWICRRYMKMSLKESCREGIPWEYWVDGILYFVTGHSVSVLLEQEPNSLGGHYSLQMGRYILVTNAKRHVSYIAVNVNVNS